VVRHYGEIAADSTLTFRPFSLGPDPAMPVKSSSRFDPTIRR
jgi:hypothetical protein